jgi:hypothetical protein
MEGRETDAVIGRDSGAEGPPAAWERMKDEFRALPAGSNPTRSLNTLRAEGEKEHRKIPSPEDKGRESISR